MSVKVDLSQVGAFRFVSPEARQNLAQISKIVEKKQGEAILIHDEPVPGIYIVIEGEVGVYPPGLSNPLINMGTMASFGEMSFLEKTRASATIRAETPRALLVMILQQELALLIDKDPSLGQALYKGIATNLSQKLRLTTDRIAHELGAGRQILLSLSSDEVAVSLASLPAEVTKQNDLIIEGLKSCAKLTEEISKQVPGKSESLTKLQGFLGETKDTCLSYYPKLAQQMTVVIDFVRRMEKFILRITHD